MDKYGTQSWEHSSGSKKATSNRDNKISGQDVQHFGKLLTVVRIKWKANCFIYRNDVVFLSHDYFSASASDSNASSTAQ